MTEERKQNQKTIFKRSHEHTRKIIKDYYNPRARKIISYRATFGLTLKYFYSKPALGLQTSLLDFM